MTRNSVQRAIRECDLFTNMTTCLLFSLKILFIYYLFIYLKNRVKAGRSGREQSLIHLLVHFPNGCAKLKSKAYNSIQVSCQGGRPKYIVHSPLPSQVQWQKVGMEVQPPELKVASIRKASLTGDGLTHHTIMLAQATCL